MELFFNVIFSLFIVNCLLLESFLIGSYFLFPSPWSFFIIWEIFHNLENSLSPSVKMSFFSFLRFVCLLLFMAVLGLRCGTRAFSGCREWGLLFTVVHQLLTAVASLMAERGQDFSSCGSQAVECRLSSCDAWA